MPANTDATKPGSPKRSKWNPFSKDKRKSGEVKQEDSTTPPAPAPAQAPPPAPAPEHSPAPAPTTQAPTTQNGLLSPTATDSAYGSSEQSNSLTSSNGNPPDYRASTPTNPLNHEVPVNGDLNHAGPTVKREVHNDNGTQVTTVTTTTTTTTTVAGPRGTTTIQEPRAELPAGRLTPQPPSQSEAVSNAIMEQGRENSKVSANDTSGTSPPLNNAIPEQKTQRRRSFTPAGRAIPERDPSGYWGRRSHEETRPAHPGMNDPTPNIPARNQRRLSFENAPISPMENDGPNRPTTRMWQNFSRPGLSQPAPGEQQDNAPHQVPAALRPGPSDSSTMSNLKTAAAGLHGAAETIRGAVASEADRRIRANKATEADQAKHQAIMNSGRYEVESGHFSPQTQHSAAPTLPFSQRKPVPGNPSNGYNPSDGYRRPAPQHANTPQNPPPDPTTGVDQDGNPASGYAKPQWADPSGAGVQVGNANNADHNKRGSKMDRWLHKASSHPPNRSGPETGDLKQAAERKKLRRRSAGRSNEQLQR